MKLIIAGSRDIHVTPQFIHHCIEIFKLEPSIIVSGGCRGVDINGETYAHWIGVPIMRFEADWNKFGKQAGHLRNKQMSEYSDQLLVIHHNSAGSLDMIGQMAKINKPVWQVFWEEEV